MTQARVMFLGGACIGVCCLCLSLSGCWNCASSRWCCCGGDETANWSRSLKNETVDNITVAGSLMADHCTVRNGVDVAGSAVLQYCTIGGAVDVHGKCTLTQSTVHTNVSVNGAVILQHATVDGTVDVKGRLEAVHSTIKGTTTVMGRFVAQDATLSDVVLITSGPVRVENSHMHAITIKPSTPEKETVTLELIDTIIDGDVKFETGIAGHIVLKGTSAIKGAVVGADTAK